MSHNAIDKELLVLAIEKKRTKTVEQETRIFYYHTTPFNQ